MPTSSRETAAPRVVGPRRVLAGVRWSLALAARRAPAWFLLTVVTSVVLALVPAAQVRAVAWLVATSEHDGFRAALIPLVLLTALVGLGQVITSAENLIGQRISLRLMRDLNARLAEVAAALDPRRVTDAQVHALLDGARTSTFQLSRSPGAVISALSALLAALALGTAIWPFSPLAAGLVVLALVPNLVIFAWSAGFQDARFEEAATHGARFRYLLDQLVGGRTATELAALGAGPRIARDAGHAHTRMSQIQDRLYALLLRGDLIGGLASAALLGGALIAVLAEGGGAAGLSAGVLGVIAGLQATRGAGFAVGDVISAGPVIARFRQVQAFEERPAHQRVVSDVRRLEVRDLTVSYPGTPTPALHEASLTATRGEMVALVGVNGAGKTTLVHAVMGIVDRDEGQVLLDGAEADELTTAERFSRFGLVTQEFGRYEMTVREAVALGSPREDVEDAEIWAALAAARARTLVERLPHGLDTQLGPQFGGVGLSGGQWQRIALARIHLRGAGIRILDEPTSAIDAEAEQEVFAQLRETADQHVTIVVSHRAWTLRDMDRIHVLEEGRVVEAGTFAELMAPGSRFSAIFAEQLTG
ncbi:ATP-binding cassette domain-containing protein [Brachybacterium fresconis]|uniref:ATP-binding cassette subfamily B protein n=1 Tax=Brachybacterium fresconis TaxID=173363 RepID=A0ABS4YQ61_9MICO|nr:ABC transporter ATP-binding protein [Brachybacterium fresconis]MBP2410899.1 ATP-binding cassette subfamily B protein [Brachybacterium fresconis]